MAKSVRTAGINLCSPLFFRHKIWYFPASSHGRWKICKIRQRKFKKFLANFRKVRVKIFVSALESIFSPIDPIEEVFGLPNIKSAKKRDLWLRPATPAQGREVAMKTALKKFEAAAAACIAPRAEGAYRSRSRPWTRLLPRHLHKNNAAHKEERHDRES